MKGLVVVVQYVGAASRQNVSGVHTLTPHMEPSESPKAPYAKNSTMLNIVTCI